MVGPSRAVNCDWYCSIICRLHRRSEQLRPIFHGDVVAAARVIYPLEPGQRRRKLSEMITMSSWANRFRKQNGRAHPVWGDGSLMTAALANDPPPEPALDNREYCSCLALVFETLVAR